jgi:hypothetical protein
MEKTVNGDNGDIQGSLLWSGKRTLNVIVFSDQLSRLLRHEQQPMPAPKGAGVGNLAPFAFPHCRRRSSSCLL